MSTDWITQITNCPFIDPRSYGAMFDGVTDDTNAIQAAINAAQATVNAGGPFAGGIVLLPPGISIIGYPSGSSGGTAVSLNITGPIAFIGVDKISTCLRKNSSVTAGGTLINATLSLTSITAGNAYGYGPTIGNFTLDMVSTDTVTTGINAEYWTRGEIFNIKIAYGGYGIVASSCANTWIDKHCSILYQGVDGIQWTQDSNPPFTTYSITTASWSSGTATYTISGTNTSQVGDYVTVSGASNNLYNFPPPYSSISAVTTNTISVLMPTNPGSWTSGGSPTISWAAPTGGGENHIVDCEVIGSGKAGIEVVKNLTIDEGGIYLVNVHGNRTGAYGILFNGTTGVSSFYAFVENCKFDSTGTNVGISSFSWSSGVLTVNTGAAHGYSTGWYVIVRNANPVAFNCAGAILSVPTSTSFTIALTGNPGSYVGGANASTATIHLHDAAAVYVSSTWIDNSAGGPAVVLDGSQLTEWNDNKCEGGDSMIGLFNSGNSWFKNNLYTASSGSNMFCLDSNNPPYNINLFGEHQQIPGTMVLASAAEIALFEAGLVNAHPGGSPAGNTFPFLSSPNFYSIAYASSTQSLASGSAVTLSFDTNYKDVGGIHSTATNPSRFTAPVDGLYQATGQCAFTGNSNGTTRALLLKVNGSYQSFAPDSAVTVSGSANIALQITTLLTLSQGDYVEFLAYQDSLSSLNTLGTPWTWGQLRFLQQQ